MVSHVKGIWEVYAEKAKGIGIDNPTNAEMDQSCELKRLK